MNASRTRCAIAAAVVAFLLIPAAVCAQRLGVFLDDQAGACDGPLESFGRSHVWVFAFVPPESLVSGVTFRIVPPAELFVVAGSERLPRDFMGESHGTLTEGIDIRFQSCVSPDAPFLVIEFDVEERWIGEPRPDLQLQVRGAGVDSIAAIEPRFRICDPQDPLGEGRGVYDAPGVHTTFNCTQRCGCTTAVLRRRWGEVKALFR